jgi:hypothetical protein
MPKPGTGSALLLANTISEKIEERLVAIERQVTIQAQYTTARKRLALEATGEVKKTPETNEFVLEPIAQGKVFSFRWFSFQAPGKTKVQLFENNAAAGNFLHVAGKEGEASESVNGIVVYGPSVIVVRVSGAEAAGQCAITLQGELTERHATPHGHTP